MKKNIAVKELDERIRLNRQRLCESYYNIDNVFKKNDAPWPGDKEGRALLAFVSHYKINSAKIPCMELMVNKIPEATDGRMFFGPEPCGVLFEQQLSGHSWYLRGLCEYYEQFGDERVMGYLTKTVEEMYLPTRGRFGGYPVKRGDMGGGVSGHSGEIINGWKLSSDIGCAFMSIDGLSHYYKITLDSSVKGLIDEMTECFYKIDKVKLQAQTHCTLTAARGLMRMYDITGDKHYLEKAISIFALYVDSGMTYTYQNFNWFGKGDTWTEPCAIVDSLMLAVMLLGATEDDMYRAYAARIYFNGLATAQRPNGGAGTDTTVSKTTHVLKADMYEAYFCCTMRLAEGLWFIHDNRERIYADINGEVKKDANGCYRDGDLIYGEPDSSLYRYADELKTVDGHTLAPLIDFYRLSSEEECLKAAQRVVFD